MEEKKLDLDAPLLSVRRFAYVAPAAQTPSSPSSRRNFASVPSHRLDRKSGPVGIPGMVPFLWEQSAGRRKGGDEPTSRLVSTVERTRLETKKNEEEEEDNFNDGGSCFMSCNLSSMAGDIPHSGRLSSENALRDFVLGRFLPAAQAIASISPQNVFRNAGERRRRGLSPRISAGGGESEIGEKVCEQKLGEEGSKKTSDFNRLSSWSDSPTGGGSLSWRRGVWDSGEDDAMLLHPCEKIVCVDSNHKTGEKENNEDKAVDSDNQSNSRENMDAPPAIILLPPPLPESPSDSWLRRTLPAIASKGSTSLPFLSTQPGRSKPTVGPLSRSYRLENLGPGRAVVIPRIGD